MLSIGAAVVVVVVVVVVGGNVVVDISLILSCLRRRRRANRNFLRPWRSTVPLALVELWVPPTRVVCVRPPWLSRRIGLLPCMAMICGETQIG